ncbi:MAG: Gfo/Idh/MocA family oxidoreductase [Armatimonadetes bacterium]|nr:Gfo/Idh/MocA family oxidoreductase [Armatimonadota bacterium]
MGTLRCGVSGLGRGRTFIERLNGIEGCEVVAVCDPDEGKVEGCEGLNGYLDFETMLAEAALDLVAVIGPGPTHAPQSLLALDHGVHVLSETPCVYSLDEASAIVQAVRRSGCRYMLSEDYIFMGWVQRWRELVESGELGEIVAAQAEYTHDCRGIFLVGPDGRYLPWSERGRPDVTPSWRASHLPPLSYCSHTLGPLLHLLGDRCQSVTAFDAGSRTYPEAGTIDYASAVLKTEAGRVITLTNGFGVAHPFIFFAGLIGTRGSVRCVSYNFGDAQMKLYLDRDGGGWQDLTTAWFDRSDGRHWLSVLLEEFVESIRNDSTPPIDVYRSMDYTLPGICAHLSAARGGERLEVPDLRGP